MQSLMTGKVFRAAARTKSGLSDGLQRLVELMQDNPFCQFKNVPIRDGEPILDPLPVIIREIKFGTDNRVHPSRDKRDFFLKQQHLELFALFEQMGTGTVAVLDVKAGLPFRVFLVATA
jgi:hypothetical protein